ncbi:hypothetical protein QFC19_003071 [Naganishia cerealis]|uniref:Uncharacterized protein n=1 Tax=Naganishia cerealis TaxID=610337 RepID=A0ACC2W5S5_9TREE|nr:hypothetical protein QFC19_003071 [Naganishia cerealis]
MGSSQMGHNSGFHPGSIPDQSPLSQSVSQFGSMPYLSGSMPNNPFAQPSRARKASTGQHHHPYSRSGTTTPLEPPSPWEVNGSGFPFGINHDDTNAIAVAFATQQQAQNQHYAQSRHGAIHGASHIVHNMNMANHLVNGSSPQGMYHPSQHSVPSSRPATSGSGHGGFNTRDNAEQVEQARRGEETQRIMMENALLRNMLAGNESLDWSSFEGMVRSPTSPGRRGDDPGVISQHIDNTAQMLHSSSDQQYQPELSAAEVDAILMNDMFAQEPGANDASATLFSSLSGMMRDMQEQQLQQPPVAGEQYENHAGVLPQAVPNANAPSASEYSAHGTSYGSGSAARYGSSVPNSNSGRRPEDIVTGILNDDFFTTAHPATTPVQTPSGTSGFNTSRRTSQSGGEPSLVSPHISSPIASVMPESEGPADELVKKDPLATQVWKAYAKAKNTLPNGPRMENLTWRLMHMTLKKTDGTPKPSRVMDLVPEEQELQATQEEERDVPSEMTGEEVERGRRGRFRGKGKVVGFDAESPQDRQDSPDAMDWRAASRSRSRASVMDWRPSSRSRSRSTFNRNRNPYDHASEIHSQAMLAAGTDNPFQEHLLAYTQGVTHDGQWPLALYTSSVSVGEAQLGVDDITRLVATGSQSPRQEELAGLSSFTSKFSPEHQRRRDPVNMSQSAFEYDQAIRTAAAYDAFASSVPNDEPLHLTGEALPTSLTSQSGPSATLALSPRNYPKLPGISGPGLYDETRENFHPQYGFLPRRVRKTSFDHTVAQGSSAESGSGLLPPPRAGKVSTALMNDVDWQLKNMPLQVRKRSADMSPSMTPQAQPGNIPLPGNLPVPTSASANVPPGSFPNTAFTFSVPGSYEAFFDINAASANTPSIPHATAGDPSEREQTSNDTNQAYMHALQNMLNQGILDDSNRTLFEANSDNMDSLNNMAAIQAGLLQSDNAVDFQQLMQQYLHTNATANPFTHINPAQVLGQNFNNAIHPLAASGTLSNFSSPTGMSPSVYALQPQQNLGPTKPLPKAVGGKPISTAQKPIPVRSNSSPNLVALKLAVGSRGIKGGEGASSVTEKGASVAKQGHKSGPNTPSSEDAGGTILSTSETPTHCSNCQTTNTPLWRRDPEGQPLCNVSHAP